VIRATAGGLPSELGTITINVANVVEAPTSVLVGDATAIAVGENEVGADFGLVSRMGGHANIMCAATAFASQPALPESAVQGAFMKLCFK
jgi:hypothetical protein